LDGTPKDIPVYGAVREAVDAAKSKGTDATHLVIGVAPDGGRLSPENRTDVLEAIGLGLNIDSGLHDFLTEDPEIVEAAARTGARIRDVRKPPPKSELHFFSGKIEEVDSLKVAVLGTDSAIGKRTTAWILNDALQEDGYTSEMVGTGQTAWMQGARFGIVLDSLVTDFVAGEIEHVMWDAWRNTHADVLFIEGQGSLMNPAYPGGYEILAAGRPDIIVLQAAPARMEYDGFPGYLIQPLDKQIMALELISGKRVVAVTVNHEGLNKDEALAACDKIEQETGLPTSDVIVSGPRKIVETIKSFIRKTGK
jgi:uncharacterized NAD-dependent epimerase/dehydratase family protein